jgi:hypothetical protein
MCPEWSLIDLTAILVFETIDIAGGIAGGEQFGQVSGYQSEAAPDYQQQRSHTM